MKTLDLALLIHEMILDELSMHEMDPNYLKGLTGKEREKRKKEIESRAKKDTAAAYRPFATDKTPSGKPREPKKKSKWTTKAAKMGFGPKKESAVDESMIDEQLAESLVKELISEILLLEKKGGDKVTKALKNKAKKSGAPVSALRAIYNKGLAAWRTGHRPGASQHAWAMARVNSVLAGGPARKVDATQWKQIKKARGKKKKK